MGAQVQNPDILSRIDTDNNQLKDITGKEMADFLSKGENISLVKDQFSGENFGKFKDELKNYDIDKEIAKDTKAFFDGAEGKKLLWEDPKTAKEVVKLLLFCEKIQSTPMGKKVNEPTEADIQERYKVYTTEKIESFMGTGDIKEIKKDGDFLVIKDKNNTETKIPFKEGKFAINQHGGIKTSQENVAFPSDRGCPVYCIGEKAYKVSFQLGKITCEEIIVPNIHDPRIKDVATKVGVVLDKPNLQITAIKIEGSGAANRLYKVQTNDNTIFTLDANLSPEGDFVGDKKIDFSTVREKMYTKQVDTKLNVANHAFLKLPNGEIYVIETERPQDFYTQIKELETAFSENNKTLNSGTDAVFAYYKAVETLCTKMGAKRVSAVVDEIALSAGGTQMITENANLPGTKNRDEKLLQAYNQDITYIEAKPGTKLLESVPNMVTSYIPRVGSSLQIDAGRIVETGAKDTFKNAKNIDGEMIAKEFKKYTVEGWKKEKVEVKESPKAAIQCSKNGFITPDMEVIKTAAQKGQKELVKLAIQGETECYLPVQEIVGKSYDSLKPLQKNIKEPLVIKVDNAFVCVTSEKIYALGDQQQIERIQNASEGVGVWFLTANVVATAALTYGLMHMTKQDWKNAGEGIKSAGTGTLDAFKKVLDATGKMDLRFWKMIDTFAKGNILGMLVNSYTGQVQLEAGKQELAKAKAEGETGVATTASIEITAMNDEAKEKERKSIITTLDVAYIKKLQTQDYTNMKTYLGHKMLLLSNAAAGEYQVGEHITTIEKRGDDFYITTQTNKGKQKFSGKEYATKTYKIDKELKTATVVEATQEQRDQAAEVSSLKKRYEVLMDSKQTDLTQKENQIKCFSWYQSARYLGEADQDFVNKKNTIKDMLSTISTKDVTEMYMKTLDDQLDPTKHLYVQIENQIVVIDISKTSKPDAIRTMVGKLEKSLGSDKQAVATLLYITQHCETKTIGQVYRDAETLFSVDKGISQSANKRIKLTDKDVDEKYLSLYQSTAGKVAQITKVNWGSGFSETVVNSLKGIIPGLGLLVKDYDSASVKNEKVERDTKYTSANERWSKEQGKVLKRFGGTKPLKNYTAEKVGATEEEQKQDPGISISEKGVITMNPNAIDIAGGKRIKIYVEGKEDCVYLPFTASTLSQETFCSSKGITTADFSKLPPLLLNNQGVITCLINGNLVVVGAKEDAGDMEGDINQKVEGKDLKFSKKEVLLYDLLASSAVVVEELARAWMNKPTPTPTPTIDSIPTPEDPTPATNTKTKESTWSKLSGLLDNPYMGYITGAFSAGLVFNAKKRVQKREIANIYAQMENGPAMMGTIESQVKTKEEVIKEIDELLQHPERCVRPETGVDFGAQMRNRVGHLFSVHAELGKRDASSLLSYEVKSITKEGGKYIIDFDDGFVQKEETFVQSLSKSKKPKLPRVEYVLSSESSVVNKDITSNTTTEGKSSKETTSAGDISIVQLPDGTYGVSSVITSVSQEMREVIKANQNKLKDIASKYPDREVLLSKDATTGKYSFLIKARTGNSSEQVKENLLTVNDINNIKTWKIDKKVFVDNVNALQNTELRGKIKELIKKGDTKALQGYILSQLPNYDASSSIKNGDVDGWFGTGMLKALVSLKEPNIYGSEKGVNFADATQRKKMIQDRQDPKHPLMAQLEKKENQKTFNDLISSPENNVA